MHTPHSACTRRGRRRPGDACAQDAGALSRASSLFPMELEPADSQHLQPSASASSGRDSSSRQLQLQAAHHHNHQQACVQELTRLFQPTQSLQIAVRVRARGALAVACMQCMP